MNKLIRRDKNRPFLSLGSIFERASVLVGLGGEVSLKLCQRSFLEFIDFIKGVRESVRSTTHAVNPGLWISYRLDVPIESEWDYYCWACTSNGQARQEQYLTNSTLHNELKRPENLLACAQQLTVSFLNSAVTSTTCVVAGR